MKRLGGLARGGMVVWLGVCGVAMGGETSAGPGKDGFRHNGITAHRGDQAEAPENTVPAFEDAVKSGADWVEMDVYTTRDGEVVVSHDATTKRCGDRAVRINDATWEEVRGVDVAASYRKREGLTVEQYPKVGVPLLKEVLGVMKGHPEVRVSIQPKDGSTDRAVGIVKEMGMVGQVSFNDGSLEKMRRVKELEPRLRVHWDRPAKVDVEADLATARKYGFEAMVVEQKGVTPEVVRRVHEAGLEMGVWTVDDPKAGRRFLDWGVDRIYTDFPRVMLEVKREREAAGAKD